MARHYRSFCLSTQVAIFPLSHTPQRGNNGASFNLTGNASVEFWCCDRLIARTYPRLYTVSFARYRLSSIMRTSRTWVSACIPYERVAGSRRREGKLASKTARARARFTGVRGNYATSFDTECSRSPPRGGVHRYEYSHPVLSTGTGAHFVTRWHLPRRRFAQHFRLQTRNGI